MFRVTKSLLISTILISNLSAVSVTIYNGWNLISTAGVDNVQSSCLLKEIQGKSSLWTFENGKWKGNSNDQKTQEAIKNAGFGIVSTITKEQGFWVYNPNDNIKLEMNCTK